MQYLRVPLTDKALAALKKEAAKKGTTASALASTWVSTYPPSLK
jgi:hypothetical protein